MWLFAACKSVLEKNMMWLLYFFNLLSVTISLIYMHYCLGQLLVCNLDVFFIYVLHVMLLFLLLLIFIIFLPILDRVFF